MLSPLTASDPSGLGSLTGDVLLRLVADTVPVMLAYYDAQNLRCTFANQRFADFVGRAADSLPGLQASDVLDAHTWQQIQPLVQRALQGETMQHTCQHLEAGRPERIVSANIGCIEHLGAGSSLPVQHWIELIDEKITKRT